MSLSRPHPLWTTAGSSPAKVSMATVQAQMISGRYWSEALCSNWSNNKLGVCLISASCTDETENIPHILYGCPALQPTRDRLKKFSMKYCDNLELAVIKDITTSFLNATVTELCQFLPDCSVLEPDIDAKELYGDEVITHLFNITRTWVYTLHKERMKRLGRWNPLWSRLVWQQAQLGPWAPSENCSSLWLLAIIILEISKSRYGCFSS